jgi:hypothetical protein
MRVLSERPFMPKPGPSDPPFFATLISSLTKILGEVVQRSNVSITNDGDTAMVKPLKLAQLTVAQVNGTAFPASSWAAGICYVTDASGGATVAYSNGTNWKRVYDNANIS